jgi:hypothetical protein
MSCEHCWVRAQMLGVEYRKVLAMAEREQWPCTKDDLQGAKLRAGQFWNDSTMSDTRVNPPVPENQSPSGLAVSGESETSISQETP